MPARRSRSRRTVALIVTATVAGGTIALTVPAIANAAPANCAATFNLFIPGTWETSDTADPDQPVGMLKPVADALKSEHGKQAEIYTLPYMARAFDNGHTYADSKADAIAKSKQVLSEIKNSCPNTKFTIIGYSQGADAAGDLASEIGNGKGPVDASQVLAVGLLADPGAGTKGSAVVGPRTSGQGIADPRPQGMGALSGRVASICDPGDLYCSIEKGSSPLLGSLGSILSKSPSGVDSSGTAGGNSQLASALTSDFSGADLPALGTNVSALGQQLSEPTVDIKKVASTATSIAKTLAPLTDLLDSGAANPSANGQLAAAPAGTAEHNASEVLTKAGQSDLTTALDTATKLANTANKLTGGDSLSLPSTSAEVQTLSKAADTLGVQVAPVASTPTDALSSATSVLSVLKPTVVVNQVLNVATGVTSLDMPGILNNLTLLPQKVAALDARGAHDIAGQLNNQFSPLVKMAAAVDLKWVSQVLSVIPDPSGSTQIAALVASILANVDVIKLANIVGQIQEIAWAAVEKLLPPPGQMPDPLGAAAAMTGLVPVGLDLASVAMNMFSGKATKTAPALLGKQTNTVSTNITTQAENLDLPQLSNYLVKLSQSQGAEDLVSLVGEGLSAANFFTSGAHTNYNALVVDNAGRNAIQWLSDWLNLQIGRAA
ncbi:cutinase family protein [Rhodococcus sp. WS1]|uniref:cutinase family protein n=1 Tax=unclassified Rhodococcus (in: high G+C Gram-positive bacteria) TaxID=192944 RepID=UPI001141C389|nr:MULTISPECIES: cutinase family protein [unclassified Rhodococcus (in: high G+C Gram-positive bacteria)]ROZ52818.1 cutinase family protein [Rhodococcus sp. WS1]TQC34342.1 cutinase family protein [Rhodococcus sp. WS7]